MAMHGGQCWRHARVAELQQAPSIGHEQHTDGCSAGDLTNLTRHHSSLCRDYVVDIHHQRLSGPQSEGQDKPWRLRS